MYYVYHSWCTVYYIVDSIIIIKAIYTYNGSPISSLSCINESTNSVNDDCTSPFPPLRTISREFPDKTYHCPYSCFRLDKDHFLGLVQSLAPLGNLTITGFLNLYSSSNSFRVKSLASLLSTVHFVDPYSFHASLLAGRQFVESVCMEFWDALESWEDSKDGLEFCPDELTEEKSVLYMMTKAMIITMKALICTVFVTVVEFSFFLLLSLDTPLDILFPFCDTVPLDRLVCFFLDPIVKEVLQIKQIKITINNVTVVAINEQHKF